MAVQSLKFLITSQCPFLMHNGSLADPTSSFARAMREITSKSKKTDADLEQLSKLEFLGGMYYDSKKGPIIPADMISASLMAAAKTLKKGKDAQKGLAVEEHASLRYDGPRTPDDLWLDANFRLVCGVKMRNSRIIRTRPKFDSWSAEITIQFDDQIFNARDIERLVGIAGKDIGIGDWRPKFGRFSSELAA